MDIVGSHQRLLIAAAVRTRGPILELGVGWYSTPILHELAKAQGRKLVTIDNNNDWLKQFKNFECSIHRLILVGWWGEADYACSSYDREADCWGTVFIDQGQPIEREYAIRRLLAEKEQPELFVMHDTEEGFAYGYDRTLPMFRYKWTDKSQKAHTTIASNVRDVTKLEFVNLPSVDPTKDVT